MCQHQFISIRYPIVLSHPLKRQDTRESASTIESQLLLQANRVHDPTKSRDPTHTYRCKCCPCRIADHPSSTGIPKRKSTNPFATQNEQCQPVHLWHAVLKVRKHKCD